MDEEKLVQPFVEREENEMKHDSQGRMGQKSGLAPDPTRIDDAAAIEARRLKQSKEENDNKELRKD